MDPLSDVLSLLKPQSLVSGGFAVEKDVAIRFPSHQGIKCYALLSGQCWLSVESTGEPIQLNAGDCFILPRGLPFSLATDLDIPSLDYREFLATRGSCGPELGPGEAGNYIAGGFFVLAGAHAAILLQSLPPIIHIRRESDKAAMRWSLERMKEELRNPQPGGVLVAQQLAYMMLVQALRLHLAEGARGGVGWLFALADKQMSTALGCIHEAPGHAWTLHTLAGRAGMSRSIFALRFKETVGMTPIEYLTRWRMLVAGDRLRHSSDSISAISLSLGYESESAFGKAFRRVMGCSPRQYGRNATSAQKDQTAEALRVAS